VDISDVKALVDASDERIKKQIGEAQAANQKALQEVLESANKTKAEKDAEIAKINSEFTELRKAYVEIEKKAGRPAATGDGKSVILTPDQQEHKRLFTQFLRKGEDSGLREIERKAMNSQSDPDGGYLVLPEIDQAIDRFAPTMAAVYRLANVVKSAATSTRSA
jgi:HK97 family phage major capsid protein